MTFPAVMEIGTDRLFVERPAMCSVYIHLVGVLDLDEYRIVKVTSLARRLAIHEDTASDALRTLCARGYLLKKPFDGRTSTYKLVYRRSETPPNPDRSSR